MNSAPSRQTLAFEGESAGSWRGRPFRLLSLLDVLRFQAGNLYIMLIGIEEFYVRVEQWQKERGNEGLLTQHEANNLSLQLSWLRVQCERADLTRTFNHFRKFRDLDTILSQDPETY